MPVTFQQPYNMFQSPGLKKPVGVYDPKKSVQENLEGKGSPSPQNIVNAYGTPKAQSDLSQPMKHGDTQSQPVLDVGSSTAGMDYLNSLYTDPQEEERLRKASVMNQRIMAIGDAVRHIGNIASTINYAPSQQLNSPVLEEQARYERGKALRDRANQQYYTYQQQKEAQDAKARQWEAEQKQKADQWNATFKYNAMIDAANLAEKQRQYDETSKRNKEKDKIAAEQWEKAFKQKEQHQKQQMGLGWYNAKTSRMNAERLANGGSDGSHSQPIDTPYGKLRLSGKTHDADQIRQIWGYARDLGLTSDSQIEARLRALGLGKDDSDAIKRQTVMDLMRTDGRLSKYAADRLDAVFDDGYPTDGVPYAPQPQTPFSAPWSSNRGGSKQTIEGFGGGSTSTDSGLQIIPGFGGN